jgi:ankyrin repeat protein
LVRGLTPLHIATRENHIIAVKRLVEKGADIEAKTEVRGKPLLRPTW